VTLRGFFFFFTVSTSGHLYNAEHPFLFTFYCLHVLVAKLVL